MAAVRDPQRIPVLAGVGEVVDRHPENGSALDPAALMSRALAAAEVDAGAGGLLAGLDCLYAIPATSWWYDDLAGLLGGVLGMTGETINERVGGDQPARLLSVAAERITRGEINTAAIVGGEAHRSKQKGLTDGWPDCSSPKIKVADFVTALGQRYGLQSPPDCYPLYENAMRHARGLTLAEAQRESAENWSSFSQVAAENPFAWIRQPASIEAIETASAANRLVVFPYSKLMVANNAINQGAAMLVMSLAAARAAGIPDSRLAHIGTGVGGAEPTDILARDRYDRSLVMQTVVRGVLTANDRTARDIDLIELYSCFPCVPKMARAAIDLDPALVLTVTGGLTFFGGPGSNYMSHAAGAMLRRIRARRGTLGLLYGQGEFVTKHHAVLIGAQPFAASENLRLEDGKAFRFDERPRIVDRYDGPARIETHTTKFDRYGNATIGIVIARTPGGARVPALVHPTDPQSLGALIDGEIDPIGAAGIISAGNDTNIWRRAG